MTDLRSAQTRPATPQASALGLPPTATEPAPPESKLALCGKSKAMQASVCAMEVHATNLEKQRRLCL